MLSKDSERRALIGCAIGAAVVSLLANGMHLSRENLLYELERIKANSSDEQVKKINTEAAEIIRRREH